MGGEQHFMAWLEEVIDNVYSHPLSLDGCTTLVWIIGFLLHQHHLHE